MIINTYVKEIIDEAKKEKLAKQAVDLALLSNGMLKGKDLAEFISRSVDMID